MNSRLFAPPKWNYSNPELDGILFFTQRIDEMLFNFTITKYKAPVLNTHLLIVEYLSVFNGEKIAHYNLTFILEEIKCSLQKDPVLKAKLGTEYLETTCQSLCTLPNERKVVLLALLNSTWGDSKYLEWCIQYAKEVLKKPKNKEDIELMLRYLVPELIGHGYSSAYIYNYNKVYFSVQENASYNKACEFLDRFDGLERKYTVYIVCDSSINAFKTSLQDKLEINFDEDANFALLKHDSNQTIVYIKDIDAVDDNAAANYAYKTLNFFLRFYSAISNKKPLSFSDKSMVFEKGRESPSYVAFQSSGFSAIQVLDDEQAPQITTTVINGIVKNGPYSYEHLKRVLDLHNTSLSNSDYNSAFLNLWSILEVLSLSHDDKVNSVIEVLVPLLKKDYYYNCFEDFSKKLKSALGDREFSKLLEKITESDESINKIALFLLSPSLTKQRQEIIAKLVKFPVLRYRIHYFSEISFNTKTLINILNAYIQRTTWHIRRIYRIRNSITHSGIVPENIKSIGDHLHSYVDTLLLEVIFNLSSDKRYGTIENVLLDIILSSESLFKSLIKDSQSEKDIVNYLLQSSYTI